MQEWNCYQKIKNKKGKLKNFEGSMQKAFSKQQEGELQTYNGIKIVFSLGQVLTEEYYEVQLRTPQYSYE